jgi:beta-N-acetylhexosaminidase
VRIPILAALAVTAVVLASCSSGSGGGGTPPTASGSPAGSPSTAPATPSTTPERAPATGGPGVPTDAELQAARTKVSALDTRALAAQLVVARYPGSGSAGAAQVIRSLGVGGVAVFADNVPPSAGSVVPTMRQMSEAAHAAMRATGRDWPAVVAVDQEGGPIARIGAPATEFAPAMALGAANDRDLAVSQGQASGRELRAMGFTMVLAPTVDVTVGAADPTIGVRSPGSDSYRAGRVGAGLIAGYGRAGIVPVAKHFPGHGTVTADSHLTLPVQRASRSTLQTRDLAPFAAVIEDGAPAVMTAHIVVSAYDPDAPATLSPAVTTGLLRKRLGFTGLVVTDALEMAAVTSRHGSARAAVLAVRAGADVLLMPAEPAAAISGLVAAVSSGELTRARLVESVARMVATQERVLQPVPPASVVGTGYAVARQVAAASVTQLRGACGRRLVGDAVTVSGATAQDRQRFTEAARRAGLRVGGGTSVVLLGGSRYNAGTGAASGRRTGSGDVVVSLDTPYGLAGSSASVAKIALFDRSPAAFEALADVLTGRTPARGTLPVLAGDAGVGAGCA